MKMVVPNVGLYPWLILIVPNGTVMGCMVPPQIDDHSFKLQLDENNTI